MNFEMTNVAVLVLALVVLVLFLQDRSQLFSRPIYNALACTGYAS